MSDYTYEWYDWTSDIFGYASLACWIIVGFPEFYEMYKHKSGAGMSITFLLLWGVGDIFSLAGGFLSQQLITTIVLAAWYCIMDAILVVQVIWYEHLFPGGYGAVTIHDIIETYGDEEEELLQPSIEHHDHHGRGDSSPLSVDSKSSFFEGVIGSLAHSTTRGFTSHWEEFVADSRFEQSRHPPLSRRASIAHEGDFYQGISSPRNMGANTNRNHNNRNQASSLFTVLLLVGAGSTLGVHHYYNNASNIVDNYTINVGHNEPNIVSNRVLLGINPEEIIEPYRDETGYLNGVWDKVVGKGTITTQTTTTTMSSSDPDIDPDACMAGPYKCWIGAIFGWISAILYILSRIPQLVKNFMRKSCDGVSIWMFFFSVLGNVTYSMSIFIKLARPTFDVVEKMPWIVGSVGTLAFDFAIFMQFFFYKKRSVDQEYSAIN